MGAFLSPHHLSWRWLYVAATPVLLVVAFMRRRLPESSRFQAAASAGRLAASWRSLLRPPHGRLLVLVCAASALGGLLAQPSVFVIDFMQTQRHLSASVANLILVGAGALAIPVLVGAGSISDRLGRKRVGCSFLALSVAGTLCFFFLARGPAGLFLALAITYAGQFGAWPTLTGFSTELFPTSHRALASSAAGIARVTGTCISFVLAALLIGLTGSLARSVALLAAGPLLALVIVAAGLPRRQAGNSSKHRRSPTAQRPFSPARARADLGVECGRLLRAERDIRRGAPGTPPHRVGSVPPVGGQHAGEHLERGRAR